MNREMKKKIIVQKIIVWLKKNKNVRVRARRRQKHGKKHKVFKHVRGTYVFWIQQRLKEIGRMLSKRHELNVEYEAIRAHDTHLQQAKPRPRL